MNTRTEKKDGHMVSRRGVGRGAAVRGGWHGARVGLAALALASGIAAAGFVAGYALGPVVYGQMPGLMLETFVPYVGK